MFRRFLAIVEKEFIQAVRDRGTLAIMLTIPLIQLILFAYAININVRNIPLVVADQSLDSQSRNYLQVLVNSGYFKIVATASNQDEVIQAIDAGQASAGVVIPAGFAEAVARGDARVLALVDGSDLFPAQSAYNAFNIIGSEYSAEIVTQDITRLGAVTQSLTLPVLNLNVHVLYNPDLTDLWFIIPGMIAMFLQTQTVALTAAAVVREREYGTLEQLLVSPIHPFELMAAKVVPYFCIGLLNLAVILVTSIFVFHVPFQGNLVLFLALTFLYIFSGLGLGLMVSVISENQRQTNQLVMLIMMLALVLGGFVFPRYTMPAAIQWVGDLFPMTYFIPIARGIFTKGIGFQPLAGQVLALGVYFLLMMVLATRSFRRRLE
jgi:ABC-2 type transport system permease protein